MIRELLENEKTGKQAELREGIDGSGKTIFQLQWLRVVDVPNGSFPPGIVREFVCYDIDTFPSEAEARRYFNSLS